MLQQWCSSCGQQLTAVPRPRNSGLLGHVAMNCGTVAAPLGMAVRQPGPTSLVLFTHICARPFACWQHHTKTAHRPSSAQPSTNQASTQLRGICCKAPALNHGPHALFFPGVSSGPPHTPHTSSCPQHAPHAALQQPGYVCWEKQALHTTEPTSSHVGCQQVAGSLPPPSLPPSLGKHPNPSTNAPGQRQPCSCLNSAAPLPQGPAPRHTWFSASGGCGQPASAGSAG